MLFDSSKWWEYSSALDYIFRELIDSGIIASKDSISNIDFNIPKYIGSDIAIWVEKSPKIGMLIYPEYSPLLKIEVINKVINIWINNDLVLNWIGSQCNKNPSMQGFGKKLINGTRIAVEHTSLNTVFPINLATFRSSVIGDATKRYLLKQGAIVKSHFFIEDLSQRNQVLLTGARISGFSSHRLNSLEGKPDHELGYLYASTVMSLKYPGKDHRKTLSKMFPKAISKVTVDVCYDFDKLHWGDYAFSELFLQLKTYCIEGFEQTLKLCGIDIDYYDHEAITYSTCISEDDEFFVNSPSPLERNICYFKYLASTNDLVFSILPINLMYQPNYDDSLAGRLIHTIKEKGGIYDFENRLHFFPYGKVEILEDRSSNPVSDSISEGILS